MQTPKTGAKRRKSDHFAKQCTLVKSNRINVIDSDDGVIPSATENQTTENKHQNILCNET
ncbi:hypothetical protein BOX15_Mlig025716g9 [Macrostomum lignano]|uniref:Uncharacterized protein n=1 Tax=Macrostomum lignano TaxID=282301 RepID=A0A267DTJ9_9PLAT|nr:hypothetical protein BOX15_Mlig025716g9 [Macrostomum lignano]